MTKNKSLIVGCIDCFYLGMLKYLRFSNMTIVSFKFNLCEDKCIEVQYASEVIYNISKISPIYNVMLHRLQYTTFYNIDFTYKIPGLTCVDLTSIYSNIIKLFFLYSLRCIPHISGSAGESGNLVLRKSVPGSRSVMELNAASIKLYAIKRKSSYQPSDPHKFFP